MKATTNNNNNAANVKNQSTNSKANALKSIREANKETKTLSGIIKTIRSFWNEGYKDAFQYLGLTYKDIELTTIIKLWADSYWNEDKTKMTYPTRVAKKDENGEPILKDGKRVFEKTMKEYDKNFTVVKLFDALLQGKIERKEITL